MTVNRFQQIRSVIHFDGNAEHKPVGHPNNDGLPKIRPVVKYLHKLFVNVTPFDQRLSPDEQMYSTRIANFMKQ